MNSNSTNKTALNKWFLKWLVGLNFIILIIIFALIAITVTMDLIKKRIAIQETLDVAAKSFYVSILKNDRLTLEVIFNSVAVLYKTDSFVFCQNETAIFSTGIKNTNLCSSRAESLTRFESSFTQNNEYRLVLQLNKLFFYKPLFNLFIILIAGLVIIFLAIRLVLKKFNDDIIKPIINYNSYTDPDKIQIYEISEMIKKIKHSFELEKYKLKNEAIIYLSQKLAHDIRSPISTLNIISSKINDPELKFLQLAVVKQINEIANTLLDESQSVLSLETELNSKTAPKQSNFLTTMLKNLEKEYQFKATSILQNISFEIDYKKIEINNASLGLTSVIYSCINNFVQNAIDATEADGIIKIAVSLNHEQRIEITISDNGKGIPENILARLGKEVLSHGKDKHIGKTREVNIKSGNGIAIYNAKKELEENAATLSIRSVQHQGTSISILI